MTAEKCTKRRDARAKLLFCQFKPIAFLPFLLPSPSSLLKLANKSVNLFASLCRREAPPRAFYFSMYCYFY